MLCWVSDQMLSMLCKACLPAGFEPDQGTVELAKAAGVSSISISHDPMEAVKASPTLVHLDLGLSSLWASFRAGCRKGVLLAFKWLGPIALPAICSSPRLRVPHYCPNTLLNGIDALLHLGLFKTAGRRYIQRQRALQLDLLRLQKCEPFL